MKIFTEKPVVTTVEETHGAGQADRPIRLRQSDGRPRAALCAALRRSAQGAGRWPARRHHLDRGVRAYPALSRRLLHARLAPLRALFGQLHAGKVLPRPRSLQRRHGLPAAICVELRRPPHLHSGQCAGQMPASTIMEVYHRKPSGWMGTDKVFDSDGDIIDFQTAMVRVRERRRADLPHQSQRARRFPALCRDGRQGHGRGRLHPQFPARHRLAAPPTAWSTPPTRSASSASTTAPTSRWPPISSSHMLDGAPLPVSVIDALEAGLLALTMDQAHADPIRRRHDPDLAAIRRRPRASELRRRHDDQHP